MRRKCHQGCFIEKTKLPRSSSSDPHITTTLHEYLAENHIQSGCENCSEFEKKHIANISISLSKIKHQYDKLPSKLLVQFLSLLLSFFILSSTNVNENKTFLLRETICLLFTSGFESNHRWNFFFVEIRAQISILSAKSALQESRQIFREFLSVVVEIVQLIPNLKTNHYFLVWKLVLNLEMCLLDLSPIFHSDVIPKKLWLLFSIELKPSSSILGSHVCNFVVPNSIDSHFKNSMSPGKIHNRCLVANLWCKRRWRQCSVRCRLWTDASENNVTSSMKSLIWHH